MNLFATWCIMISLIIIYVELKRFGRFCPYTTLTPIPTLSSAHKISENSDQLRFQSRSANRDWIGVGGAHTRANLVAVGVVDRCWSWKSVSCMGPLKPFACLRSEIPICPPHVPRLKTLAVHRQAFTLFLPYLSITNLKNKNSIRDESIYKIQFFEVSDEYEKCGKMQSGKMF